MRSRRELIGLAALLVACGGGSIQMPRSPVDRDEVALRAFAIQPGRWRPLSPGAALKSGSRFVLQIDVGQPLHVYVARLADRKSARFSPLGQDLRATQDAPLYLPTGDSVLSLDKEAGIEDLRLVASVRPLPEAEVQARLQQIDGGTSRDPPPIIREKNRIPFAVLGRLDGSGVVTLRFLLRHG